MHQGILIGLVTLAGLGAGAQWLAWRLRVPSILVLLAVGFVAGPLTGFLSPDELLGPVTFPAVSAGAAIILFEGGLTTSWRDIARVGSIVQRLVTVGLIVTWVGTTAAAHWLLRLPWELSALLGAILVVTGPTVIGPLLRHARPHGPVGNILKFEGILNDAVGAVLAVLVFQFIEAEQVEMGLSRVLVGVAKAAVLASTLGWVASWLFTTLRQREWIPESLQNAVLLPLALGVYAAANTVQHESGLLAVTIMGIGLASQKRVDIEVSVEFTEHARTMLISMLFVLLTARMDMADFAQLRPEAVLFVAAMVLVIRPLAVWASTVGSRLSWRERVFLAAMAPRGIVAAAVSSVFALRLVDAGYADARVLMSMTFVVIAVCVAVYGLSAAPLVKLLRLEQVRPQGVLLLGANHIATTVAGALRDEGLRVVLVDSDLTKVQIARDLEFEAIHGKLLSEHVLNRLDLDDIGYFVALTANDDTNTLAVAHFRDVFGLDHVHQLQPSGDRGEPHGRYAEELRGAVMAEGQTYDQLSSLIHRGARATVLHFTSDFTQESYEARHNTRILPLFALDDWDETGEGSRRSQVDASTTTVCLVKAARHTPSTEELLVADVAE